MGRGGEALSASANPACTSSEVAAKLPPRLKREEPPDYESTNGREGAWVFNRKPARECLGLNCIGVPFDGVPLDHEDWH
jgi:hypothetical protein